MNNLCLFITLFIFSTVKMIMSQTIIRDDFSKNRLWQYDKSHIEHCFGCNDYKSYEYLTEKTGNKFIQLSTRIGQLSHFNDQRKHIKDRIELGTKDSQLSRSWSDLTNKTFWWGFQVKLPKGVKHINGDEIVITQLKTIEKNKNKKQCHPGMPFRINFRNYGTWISVTDGFNKKLKKITLASGFLDNNWSSFKIGYHFSETDGWVKVIKDEKTIFSYKGNTIFDKYKNCFPVTDLQTFIRIGVYRRSPTKDTKNDSLDFDNFIVCKSSYNECFFEQHSDSLEFGAKKIKQHFNSLSLDNRKLIQTNLINFGYNSTIDGIWGKRTSIAVEKFVEIKKLENENSPEVIFKKIISLKK